MKMLGTGYSVIVLYIVTVLLPVSQSQIVFMRLGAMDITQDRTEILITEVGEDLSNPSLLCFLNEVRSAGHVDVLSMAEMDGWYYPNGMMVLGEPANEDFYSSFPNSTNVTLFRREGANPLSPSGSFCCSTVVEETIKSVCARLVVCPALPQLSHGAIIYSNDNNGLGTVASHSCSFGYLLVGDLTRTCVGLNNWTSTAPVCEEITCGPPPSIPNGSPTSAATSGTVTYNCDNSYEPEGPIEITCQPNGQWTNLPTCRATCPLFADQPHGQVTYFPMMPSISVPENYTATFSCDPGYSLSGDQVLLCTTEAFWNGSIPSCLPVCMDLPPITNGVISYSPPDFPRLTGAVAHYTCAPGYKIVGHEMRTCGSSGVWTLETPACDSTLDMLVNRTITEENFSEVTSVLSSFANESLSGPGLQSEKVLAQISDVFSRVSEFVSGANMIVETTVVEDLTSSLNSLSQWDTEVLVVNSTSSILQSFEVVLSTYAQQNSTSLSLSVLSVMAKLGDVDMFRQEGSMSDFNENADGIQAFISLPGELFEQVSTDQGNIGLFYALYEDPSLFPVTESQRPLNSTRETVVGSSVIAATVGLRMDLTDVNPPVEVYLPINGKHSANFTIRDGSERCVSWDFSSKSWVTDGCETIREGDTVQCECTHLTNFAVLIDICSRAQDCFNDPVAEQVLSVITYIGVLLSCLGLVLIFITLLAFKELRNRDNTKYHVQLCIAIFCVLVVFAAGIEQTEPYGGCVVVSILIHYFSLVAVMWMGAEAVLMFQKLVIVFGEITKTYLVIVSLVCWLVPLIPVVLVLIIDLANGTDPDSDLIVSRRNGSITDHTTEFCFLKHPGVFFGAFLAPIIAVIIFNLVIFIWVSVIVFRSTRDKLKRANEKYTPKSAFRLMTSLLGVMFLFGLTWLFAAFTFTLAGNNVVRITFQALFVVCAAFQGFFLFLFFCVLDKKARDAWKELFFGCNRKSQSYFRILSSSASRTPNSSSSKKTESFSFENSLKSPTYDSSENKEAIFESADGDNKTDLARNGFGRRSTRVIISVEESAATNTTV